MFELDFFIFTTSIGMVLGLSFRAGHSDLSWGKALHLSLYPALLIAAGGALAIYPFKFDDYDVGRFFGGTFSAALLSLRFFPSSTLSRLGLANSSAKEKPQIILVGSLIAVMLLMIFNLVSNIPLASKKARWVPISESTGLASGGDIFYLDEANLIVDGYSRIAWSLHEHPRYDTGVASTVIKWEFECKKRKARVLDSTSFFGFKGDGEVLRRTRRDTDWETVQTGTNLGALYQVACMGEY